MFICRNEQNIICKLKYKAFALFCPQCNRYPLHYAYALPEDQSRPFVRLILEKDANEIESRMDKVGI